MGKIIVQNQSNLPDAEAIKYVAAVMANGRVSNNGRQYCYHTRFSNGIEVSCDLNEKSDKFVIYTNPPNKPLAADPASRD